MPVVPPATYKKISVWNRPVQWTDTSHGLMGYAKIRLFSPFLIWPCYETHRGCLDFRTGDR